MSRKICGVGVNDVGYKTYKTEVVNGKRVTVWVCPYYMTWKSMLSRCYSRSFLRLNPHYEGCKVCNEWHSLSAFRSWMMEQDWEGKQLDKDILCKGNKVYCHEYCAFVLKSTNQFIVNSFKSVGDLPIGASIDKRTGRYRAYINCNGVKKLIGTYDDPNKASEAWFKEKLKMAIEIGKKESDNRIVDALNGMFIY